ncbi:MAG: hypothetical protein WDO24_25800 [Pseudomonadota bacterium]
MVNAIKARQLVAYTTFTAARFEAEERVKVAAASKAEQAPPVATRGETQSMSRARDPGASAAAPVAELQFTTPTVDRRIALVIGNGDYKYASHLDNPKRDAEDVAAALHKVGLI